MTGVSQQRGGGSGLEYLGLFSWAGRPSAVGNSGKTFFCSDYNVLLLSNGTVWRATNGDKFCLMSGGIICGTPSSGSIGDNGALTLTTALLQTFSQGLYLYFPANAIAAGVAAGSYWTVMSSTTAGTIYNNTYIGGKPVAPVSPTAFSTTGPGAYTQTTAASITNVSMTLPGGIIGLEGYAAVGLVAERNTGAGGASTIVTVDSVQLINQSVSSGNGVRYETRIYNQFSANSRRKFNTNTGASTGYGANAMGSNTTDLSSNTTLSLVSLLTDATAWLLYYNYEFLVSPE